MRQASHSRSFQCSTHPSSAPDRGTRQAPRPAPPRGKIYSFTSSPQKKTVSGLGLACRGSTRKSLKVSCVPHTLASLWLPIYHIGLALQNRLRKNARISSHSKQGKPFQTTNLLASVNLKRALPSSETRRIMQDQKREFSEITAHEDHSCALTTAITAPTLQGAAHLQAAREKRAKPLVKKPTCNNRSLLFTVWPVELEDSVFRFRSGYEVSRPLPHTRKSCAFMHFFTKHKANHIVSLQNNSLLGYRTTSESGNRSRRF